MYSLTLLSSDCDLAPSLLIFHCFLYNVGVTYFKTYSTVTLIVIRPGEESANSLECKMLFQLCLNWCQKFYFFPHCNLTAHNCCATCACNHSIDRLTHYSRYAVERKDQSRVFSIVFYGNTLQTLISLQTFHIIKSICEVAKIVLKNLLYIVEEQHVINCTNSH